MELIYELFNRLGFVGFSLVLLVLFCGAKALYNQFTDGEEWNGEWPFWRKK